jgi:hypothetical protein
MLDRMSTKTKSSDPVRQYLADIGRRGGQAENPRKGFGSMDAEKRRQAIAKSVKTRARNRAQRKDSKGSLPAKPDKKKKSEKPLTP